MAFQMEYYSDEGEMPRFLQRGFRNNVAGELKS
jgi:hypothetical protein